MPARRFQIDWSETQKDMDTSSNGKKKKNNYDDERIYKPKMNSADKKASAIIRFLPSKDTPIPYASIYKHSWKGPGGWFINECPRSIGNACPVCEYIKENDLWETDKAQAKKFCGKVDHFVNILVVKDPMTPENEGKVFLYRFGKKIWTMISEKVAPNSEDELVKEGIIKPVNVFDWYDGANFYLKMVYEEKDINNDGKKRLIPSYDTSEFLAPSPVGDDDYIEKIHEQLYSIAEFKAEDKFRKYDDLKERFEKVNGFSSDSTTKASAPVQSSSTTVTPDTVQANAEAPFEEASASNGSPQEEAYSQDDEAFFENLKNAD